MDGIGSVVFTLIVSVVLLCAAIPSLQSVQFSNGKKRAFDKGDFVFSGKMKYAGGLNLPVNAVCNVHCLRSEMIIESNGQDFHLPSDKLISVSIMKNTEMKRQYVSSPGGAIAGAIIAGPLGALIGGGVSKRNIRLKSRYLVIAYESKERIEYILFDATYNASVANRLNKHYRYLQKRTNVRIDL